jgi:hypothetical protein
MNRRAFIYALLYAAAVIVFKLVILLGGYYTTAFGWYFSHITTVVMIIPFYVLAIRAVRDRDYGGIISGREAMRIALTVFAVGVLIVSIYNYVEFSWKGKELSEQYYHSEQYLKFLQKQNKVKPEQYDEIIRQQIATVPDSPFKATTGKLFSFLILGLSSAFICAASMKRSAR